MLILGGVLIIIIMKVLTVIINPLCTENQMCTLANSKDPDEMRQSLLRLKLSSGTEVHLNC